MTTVLIYIAATFSEKESIRVHRDKLRGMGYEVSSSWLDNGFVNEDVSDDVAIAEARNNMAEVLAANVLIIDTLKSSTKGGREFEYGYMCGKAGDSSLRMYRIGPVRNVFHRLIPGYKSWTDFYKRMPFLGS